LPLEYYSERGAGADRKSAGHRKTIVLADRCRNAFVHTQKAYGALLTKALYLIRTASRRQGRCSVLRFNTPTVNLTLGIARFGLIGLRTQAEVPSALRIDTPKAFRFLALRAEV
jgi:hypothetical protein